MQPRIDYYKAVSGAVKEIFEVQKYGDECSLEPRLFELVRVRASQSPLGHDQANEDLSRGGLLWLSP